VRRVSCLGGLWVEAAMTHVKCDTAILRAYHRIAERSGRQVAIGAAARKLLMCRFEES